MRLKSLKKIFQTGMGFRGIFVTVLPGFVTQDVGDDGTCHS